MKNFLLKYSGTVNAALYWYVVLVLMYQLLNLTFPFAFVASMIPLNLVSQALAMVGLVFFAYDVFVTRRCFDRRYASVLWAVVGALVLSSILLFDYGTIGNGQGSSLIANAKVVIWQIDLMLVIFPYCASLTKENMLKLVRTVYWAAAVVYIPCLIVSFWQYGNSIGYDAVYGTSTGTRQGFQGGRLFGLFMGVFSGGMMCMTLAIASIYLALKTERKPVRVVYGVFAALYFLYAVLSGTRSVFVALVAAAFVVAVVYFMKDGYRKRRRYVVGALLRSVAVSVAVVVLYTGIGSIAALIPQHNAEKAATPEALLAREGELCALYHPEQETTDALYPIVATYFDGKLMLSYASGSLAPYNGESLEYFEGDESVVIARMGDLADLAATLVTSRTDVGDGAEMTNGRFFIWRDYLKVAFSDLKTALFGLSPAYYMPVIYDRYADGGGLYIVEYIEKYHPNMIANGLIYDVHNAYVGILIQTGLVGLVLVGLFVYRLVSDALRVYWRQEEKNRSLLAWTMAIAFIMMASFFDSELFFRTTAASVMFWVLCGFAVNEIRHLSGKDEGRTEM